MFHKFIKISAILVVTLGIASCGGKKRKSSSAPAPVATAQNQSTSNGAPSRDINTGGTASQDQKPTASKPGANNPGPKRADPNRTDFKVNKSCDASKIKPNPNAPVEMKVNACLHLRTDISDEDFFNDRCGVKEEQVQNGNTCGRRDDVEGICRFIGAEFVLDYYPIKASDWQDICVLIGGEALKLKIK